MGFGLVILMAAVVLILSIRNLEEVVRKKDRIITDYTQDLVEARNLQVAAEGNVAACRGYLLTGDPQFLSRARMSREEFQRALLGLRHTDPEESELRLLDEIERSNSVHQKDMDEAISIETRGVDPKILAQIFEDRVQPHWVRVRNELLHFATKTEELLSGAIRDSHRAARTATTFILLLGGGGAFLAVALFAWSARILSRLGKTEEEVRRLNASLEDRVRERTAELTRAIEDLESFAYSVAHDLRAPLRAMAGLSDLVIEDEGPHLQQQGRASLERIRQAAFRMDELTEGLLDLTRLSTVDIEMESVSPETVLSKIREERAAEILARGGTLEVLSPIPPVRASSSILKLVLDQVISNALKFVPESSPPRVEVRAEARGPWVRLSIRDNGVGMKAEHLMRLFGVFQRLNRMEDYPGVGIGLALVRKGVDRMGGQVSIDSAAGQGTEVSIWLRAAEEASPDARPGNGSP
jgi:signal transduction histidine kinase